jgi:hypothetical protein
VPLKRGRKNIGKNIKRMRKEGKPLKQSIAIALRVAGVPKKRGGKKRKKKR